METNKKGLDELFLKTGRIIDDVGGGRTITWEALDEQLRGAAVGRRESTETLVEGAVEGLEKAKGYFRKEEAKMEILEKKRVRVMDDFLAAAAAAAAAPKISRNERKRNERQTTIGLGR